MTNRRSGRIHLPRWPFVLFAVLALPGCGRDQPAKQNEPAGPTVREKLDSESAAERAAGAEEAKQKFGSKP